MMTTTTPEVKQTTSVSSPFLLTLLHTVISNKLKEIEEYREMVFQRRKHRGYKAFQLGDHLIKANILSPEQPSYIKDLVEELKEGFVLEDLACEKLDHRDRFRIERTPKKKPQRFLDRRRFSSLWLPLNQLHNAVILSEAKNLIE